MVCVAEMLPGRQQGGKIGYDQLSQYIEGWLQYKESKKYERFWFVLRGNIHGTDLTTAYLFCFKDLNIHVEENAVGSIEINAQDKVEFLKCAGNKPMKCDFTIMLSETKFHFRADDEISRERWIYALCELIGKSLPPSELPTERNQIRTSLTGSHKKSEKEKKLGPFHRSKTVELPTLRGGLQMRDTRSKSLAPGSLTSLAEVSSIINDNPPVVPPPRSCCSLPFMLNPSNCDLNDIPWFYAGMRRDAADERLQKCPAGYYLLRDSESKIGSYTLAFKDVDRIKNHMITQSSDRQYRFIKSEVESSFPSPQKAVEFYMIKKHSKTLTPTPYIEKKRLIDGEERDYLLPSEMNLKSPTPPQQEQPRMVTTGYKHRELPPTPPADITSLRNLSIKENDDEAYLEMEDDIPQAKRYSPSTFSKQQHVDLEGMDTVVNPGNEYTARPPLLHGKEISLDDSESYLTISNPENMIGCTGDDNSVSRESDSDSGDESHDYFEYEKYECQNASSKRQHVTKDEKYENCDAFEKPPSLPVKPESFKEYSFSHYDDVSLKGYENQSIVDSKSVRAMTDAPPIPPRSSKPELPPRSGTFPT